jgi:hypothetical protein
MDLQIHLDHLERAAEGCRVGLTQLLRGDLSEEGYFDLLERQQSAQNAWKTRHRRYFEHA